MGNTNRNDKSGKIGVTFFVTAEGFFLYHLYPK